jgi:hypothetical protein
LIKPRWDGYETKGVLWNTSTAIVLYDPCNGPGGFLLFSLHPATFLVFLIKQESRER